MDYNTAVEYTHSLLRFGSRPGLSRITALLEALSNPQKKAVGRSCGRDQRKGLGMRLPFGNI